MSAPQSPLRRILAEITAAQGDLNLDEIARRIGISRDEADAMIDYWVRKGRLSIERITSGCPGGGCGSCADSTCGTRATGPVLLAIGLTKQQIRA